MKTHIFSFQKVPFCTVPTTKKLLCHNKCWVFTWALKVPSLLHRNDQRYNDTQYSKPGEDVTAVVKIIRNGALEGSVTIVQNPFIQWTIFWVHFIWDVRWRSCRFCWKLSSWLSDSPCHLLWYWQAVVQINHEVTPVRECEVNKLYKTREETYFL